jgi:hypothetical protein
MKQPEVCGTTAHAKVRQAGYGKTRHWSMTCMSGWVKPASAATYRTCSPDPRSYDCATGVAPAQSTGKGGERGSQGWQGCATGGHLARLCRSCRP